MRLAGEDFRHEAASELRSKEGNRISKLMAGERARTGGSTARPENR